MTEAEPYSLKLIFAWFKSNFIAQYFNLLEIHSLFLDFAYLIIYTYQSEQIEYANRSLSIQINQKPYWTHTKLGWEWVKVWSFSYSVAYLNVLSKSLDAIL